MTRMEAWPPRDARACQRRARACDARACHSMSVTLVPVTNYDEHAFLTFFCFFGYTDTSTCIHQFNKDTYTHFRKKIATHSRTVMRA